MLTDAQRLERCGRELEQAEAGLARARDKGEWGVAAYADRCDTIKARMKSLTARMGGGQEADALEAEPAPEPAPAKKKAAKKKAASKKTPAKKKR